MGTITNKSEQAIEIRGVRLQPGATAKATGKIPPSVKVLVDMGALSVEGLDDSENEGKLTLGSPEGGTKPVSPAPSVFAPADNVESSATVVSAADEPYAQIIRGLSEDSFMADGRPEVRAINAAKSDDLDNITADVRDRVWNSMGRKV